MTKRKDLARLDHQAAGYASLLADIKGRIARAQVRAVLSVNAELVPLYWDIGGLIDSRQKAEGWSAGVIPRLARALHNELPEEKGFSERNTTSVFGTHIDRSHRTEATPILERAFPQSIRHGVFFGVWLSNLMRIVFLNAEPTFA